MESGQYCIGLKMQKTGRYDGIVFVPVEKNVMWMVVH